MRPRERSLLCDILQAVRRIARYTENASWAIYESDDMLRSAVERQFTVLGEALAQLDRVAPESARRIDGYARIIGFRNVLVHGYAVINHRTVWGIIEDNLPRLLEQLAYMLEDRPA